jgi:diguanylate cyclase (GGDEF)-like protein
MGGKGRVLIVDDDRFYQEFCREILESDYEIHSTFTGQEALALISEKEYELMLLDLVMPGMEGVEVLEKAKQIRPAMDVIIMTGYATVESAIRCLKAGAADYLVKPLNPEELKIEVKRTVELRHLLDEHQEMKNLLTLYESIQRVSSSLEVDRIYRLGLDALMIAINADSGLTVFFDQDDEEVKYWLNMEEDDARVAGDRVKSGHLQPLPKNIQVINDPGFVKANGLEHLKIKSMVIFPFSILDRLEGAMVLFSHGPTEEIAISGNVRFVYEQIRRSFENAIKYQDAQRLIFIDDLTGLFNTRYLDLVLQNELSRARRFKKHLSLLFIDIDYFKLVNDNHGHLVGSWTIVEASRIIKSCLRDIDITVRYGGDEYIIILAETDRQGAQIVGERIRTELEGHVFKPKDKLELKLTCCVGIATYPDDATSKEELIHLADKAMYRGKETTRNVVYSAGDLYE